MSQPFANPYIGCTIVSSGELPKAKVLASSFLRFNSQAQFAILVIDGPNEPIGVRHVTTLSLRDIGLAPGDEWRWPMLFGELQLRTLLKPLLLEMLLARNAEVVAHFSASTEVFASLLHVLESSRRRDELCVTELLESEAGHCRRSFVAAPAAAKPSLRKWFERMRDAFKPRDGVEMNGLQPAEEILDSLPHHVISRTGFGVNYSNLDPGQLTRSNDDYGVGDQPLQTFDFRGYEPDKPHLLSRYLGLEPRILLSEHPIVAELCDAYRQQLIRAGWSRERPGRSPFEFLPSGLRLDTRMMRIYRRALVEYEAGVSAEPPSPFGPGGEQGFLKWLNQPMDQAGAGVTRYMLAAHEDREDVQAVFPDVTNAHAAGFRDWFLHFGRYELDVPPVLVSDDSPGISVDASAGPIVNIAGYFRAELGIGVAGRAIVTALEAAAIPFNTIAFTATANRQAVSFVDRQSETGEADINIICVNPDLLPVFAEETGPELRHGRYTIGVWFWEVEDFPKSFHGAFNYVDEIWVASDLMRETFRKVSPKPVFKYRLPVLVPHVDPVLTRTDFDLPDAFTFLFSFDMLSVLERKNPIALINAFKRAFPDGGPVLVIKTINGDQRCLEMEKLRYAVRGRPDIVLKDGYLSQIENSTLTALSDCYVSLHRAEGFGFTIAEAMALGKPTIATAYSGNLEFMTPDNSYLCPARRCEVGPEREPYPANSHWGEPDVDVASGLLRHVFEHPEEARSRGLRAAKDICNAHSSAIAATTISERLSVIRNRRRRSGPALSADVLEDRIAELEAENARLRRPS